MSEEHIIEIDNDAVITITVKGIKGKSCKDATKQLEAALGKVVSDKPTHEMLEQPIKNKIISKN